MNLFNFEFNVAVMLRLPDGYFSRRVLPFCALVVTGDRLAVGAVNLRQLGEYPLLADCMPRRYLANLGPVFCFQRVVTGRLRNPRCVCCAVALNSADCSIHHDVCESGCVGELAVWVNQALFAFSAVPGCNVILCKALRTNLKREAMLTANRLALDNESLRVVAPAGVMRWHWQVFRHYVTKLVLLAWVNNLHRHDFVRAWH